MDCRSTLDHMFPITHTGTQPCWQLEKNKLLHGTCSDRSGERGMRMAGANNQKGCNRGSCPEEGTTEGLMAPRNRAAPRPNLQPQQVQLCFLSPGPCQALCLYPPRLDGVQGGNETGRGLKGQAIIQDCALHSRHQHEPISFSPGGISFHS